MREHTPEECGWSVDDLDAQLRVANVRIAALESALAEAHASAIQAIQERDTAERQCADAERFANQLDLKLQAVEQQRQELEQERDELQASLDQLHGAKFSDRCYQALTSRVKDAEATLTQIRALSAKWRGVIGTNRVLTMQHPHLDAMEHCAKELDDLLSSLPSRDPHKETR